MPIFVHNLEYYEEVTPKIYSGGEVNVVISDRIIKHKKFYYQQPQKIKAYLYNSADKVKLLETILDPHVLMKTHLNYYLM
jgi:hypothetical protein